MYLFISVEHSEYLSTDVATFVKNSLYCACTQVAESLAHSSFGQGLF